VKCYSGIRALADHSLIILCALTNTNSVFHDFMAAPLFDFLMGHPGRASWRQRTSVESALYEHLHELNNKLTILDI
jgi:hypothetical protein